MLSTDMLCAHGNLGAFFATTTPSMTPIPIAASLTAAQQKLPTLQQAGTSEIDLTRFLESAPVAASLQTVAVAIATADIAARPAVVAATVAAAEMADVAAADDVAAEVAGIAALAGVAVVAATAAAAQMIDFAAAVENVAAEVVGIAAKAGGVAGFVATAALLLKGASRCCQGLSPSSLSHRKCVI